MKQLNQLQKNYLTHLLDFVSDYNTFGDLASEGQLALMYMNRNYFDSSSNYDNLVNLVNKFIKNYRNKKEATNE